jgi:glutathione reductase (NADPH)
MGVRVHFSCNVTRVHKRESTFEIRAEPNERMQTFMADLVVHGGGYQPAVKNLDLHRGQIEANDEVISTNDFLQSVSNPSVYVIGNAAAHGSNLMTFSLHDADVVTANILNGNHAKPDYRGIPVVLNTTPPLARVGLMEREAIDAGVSVNVRTNETVSNLFSPNRTDQACYGIKVVTEKATGRILGAHLLGPRADDIINLFALAMGSKVTMEELRTFVFAFPSATTGILNAL